MGDRLKDRVAIVTGAGRGIGRGEALLLAQEGAAVVVNDFGGSARGEGGDNTPAQQVVDEIKAMGGRAVANYGNVADYKTGEEMVRQALDNFGRLDIVVKNAGILRDRMVFNMTEEEWDIVIATHLKGNMFCTRHAAPYMIKQRWGRILNFSSGSGYGSSGQANYAAGKEGITGFTYAVGRELGPYGITCNVINPGGATRMGDAIPANAAQIRAARGIVAGGTGQRIVAPTQPQPRITGEAAAGTPGDANNNAPIIVWLCTEQGGAVTDSAWAAVAGK